MRCYGQIVYESGSYGVPGADDYLVWDSIKDATRSLAGTWNDLDVYPADGQGVTLLLWLGDPDPDCVGNCDASNNYPDRVYQLGPRCGVRRCE